MTPPRTAGKRGEALFHHRPVPAAALGLMAGIYLADGLPGAWLLGAGLCILGALAHYLGYRRFVLLFLFAGIGMFRGLLAQPGAFPETARITGMVAAEPEHGRGLSVTLAHVGMDGATTRGKVLLTIPAEGTVPSYGDWVTAEVTIIPERTDDDFDQRTYDLSRGIVCRAHAEAASVTPGRPGLYGTLLQLKHWAEETILTLYGPINGPLAVGMLLGDEGDVEAETLSDFRDAGIAHLLAVSGLHVGILTAAFLWLMKGQNAGLRLSVTAAFLLAYCALTAFSASTLRAGVMALCLLSAEALGRRNDSISALSFAAILILLFHPYQLFSAGFLLSFTAVYGILTLQKPIRARLFRGWGETGSALSVSLSAQLGALGPTAALFGRITPFALLANLLVVPLAALALIPALLTPFLHLLLPPLAKLTAGLGGAVIALMRAAADFAAKPGVFLLPPPNLTACLLLLAGCSFFSRYCMAEWRTRKRWGWICWGLGAILWIL